MIGDQFPSPNQKAEDTAKMLIMGGMLIGLSDMAFKGLSDWSRDSSMGKLNQVS